MVPETLGTPEIDFDVLSSLISGPLPLFLQQREKLSVFIMIIVSESRKTVEQVRDRWLVRFRLSRLPCISNHCI